MSRDSMDREVAEKWRHIPGAEMYDASNHGRIRSWRHKSGRRRKPRILSTYYDERGRAMMQFWNGSDKPLCMGLSRAVLLAFVGPPPTPHHHAAHRDGDPTNNRLDNLYWATPQQNTHDKHKHGTMARGERQGASRLTEDAVQEIREQCGNGVSHVKMAEKYGVYKGTIGRVVSRKTWRHV